MSFKPKGKKTSHDIHLPHLALLPLLSRNSRYRIVDPPLLRPHLLIEQPQALAPVHSPIGQDNRIILHKTGRVQRIRHVSRKLVELGAADGTDICSR